VKRPTPTRASDRHVGERLRTVRERRGMSIEGLGTQVGITADQLAAHNEH
jgi:hypothetical protein